MIGMQMSGRGMQVAARIASQRACGAGSLTVCGSLWTGKCPLQSPRVPLKSGARPASAIWRHVRVRDGRASLVASHVPSVSTESRESDGSRNA